MIHLLFVFFSLLPSWVSCQTIPPDALQKFIASISGSVILPSNPKYPEAIEQHDTRFDYLRPMLVVYCQDVDDVQKTLSLGLTYKVPRSIRSGGHSYAGWSVCQNCIVIDMSRLNQTTVDPETRTAIVGPGQHLEKLIIAASKYNLTLAAGVCPTVGIAGQTLGGGIGFPARKLGLTSDSVVNITIMLYNFTIVTCSETSHPDLFWALRGAGASTFGIALEFGFKLHPMVYEVLAFEYTYPFEAAADLFEQFWSYFDRTFEFQFYYLFRFRKNVLEAVMSGMYYGNPADGKQALKPFDAIAAKYNATANANQMAMSLIAARDLIGGDTVNRSARKTKSGFLHIPYVNSAALDLIKKHAMMTPTSAQQHTVLFFNLLGGAYQAVAPNATSFPHRNAFANVALEAQWSEMNQTEEVISWLEGYWSELSPRMDLYGIYRNYPDADISNANVADEFYWKENLPRLKEIKCVYDPMNVFTFPQGFVCNKSGPSVGIGSE